MDKAGLVTLLLSALFTLALGFPKQFHLVNLELNWTEAQSYCRENFRDLAVIEDAEEMAEVYSMLEKSGKSNLWIGLYDDFTSWKWSMDNTYLYNDGKAEFSDWASGQPDSKNAAQSCGGILKGTWRDVNCGSKRLPVCYDENTNEYIPVLTPMTWLSAQSYCREHYTDLASMKNQQEMDKMMKVMDYTNVWWFGLSRETWKWSDQSQSSFRGWATGQPENKEGKEFCVIFSGGQWYDIRCDHRFPFVCYSGVSMLKRIKVELIPGRPEDVNDPVWQEAILEQMKKHMKAQGIHQTFQLRWIKQPDGKIFHKKKEKKNPQ